MDIITRPRPVDVARTFHRSADWLKKLEAQGIIPPAPRDFSGRRIYTAEDVQRIGDILERRRRGVLTGGEAA
jgi:DNA-binding transcriptional MerR regulator